MTSCIYPFPIVYAHTSLSQSLAIAGDTIPPPQVPLETTTPDKALTALIGLERNVLESYISCTTAITSIQPSITPIYKSKKPVVCTAAMETPNVPINFVPATAGETLKLGTITIRIMEDGARTGEWH